MEIIYAIIGWAFGIVLLLGLFGIVLEMIDLTRAFFSKKGPGPLPWWVFFWSVMHKDDSNDDSSSSND